MKRVCACYFSPCGNVEAVVSAVAAGAAEALGRPFEKIDFTLPAAREGDIVFGPGDLVILGTPVYAGRVPNKLMPYIRDHIRGGGALCVPVVCFGNRAFDDALAELFLLAKDNGFSVLAAAAVVTEHSFAPALAAECLWGANRRKGAKKRPGFADRAGRHAAGEVLYAPAGRRRAREIPESSAQNGHVQMHPLRDLREGVPHGVSGCVGPARHHRRVYQVPGVYPALSRRGPDLR